MRDPACEEALRVAAERLAPVLGPLGFQFVPDHTSESHGPFANGFFVKDDLKIGLIYSGKAKLGTVIYENPTSNMSHEEMMKFLGLRRARGFDPIAALIDDLSRVTATLQDRAAMDAMIERSMQGRWRVSTGPRPPKPALRLGHVLLLIAAILFAVEIAVLAAAVVREGLTGEGRRDLVVIIAVCLTVAAALFGFLRRIRASMALLIGLLVLQPGAAFIAAAAGHTTTEVSAGEAVIFGVLGAALIVWVVIANRRG